MNVGVTYKIFVLLFVVSLINWRLILDILRSSLSLPLSETVSIVLWVLTGIMPTPSPPLASSACGKGHDTNGGRTHNDQGHGRGHDGPTFSPCEHYQ